MTSKFGPGSILHGGFSLKLEVFTFKRRQKRPVFRNQHVLNFFISVSRNIQVFLPKCEEFMEFLGLLMLVMKILHTKKCKTCMFNSKNWS